MNIRRTSYLVALARESRQPDGPPSTNEPNSTQNLNQDALPLLASGQNKIAAADGLGSEEH